MSQSSAAGVVLTKAEVAQSKANKKKMGYTISQLPVFRNVVQILSFTIELTASSPRSLRKFTDSTIDMGFSKLMKCDNSVAFLFQPCWLQSCSERIGNAEPSSPQA